MTDLRPPNQTTQTNIEAPRKSMTVLVCGSNGFIGSNVAKVLSEKEWRVIGVGRAATEIGSFSSRHFDQRIGDLSNPVFVEEIINEVQPNRVIFVAGPSNVQVSFLQPTHDFELHTRPLASVLEGLRIYAPHARLILVSSAAVYGEPEVLPVDETSILRPISPYGFHKVHQELLLAQYRSLYGLDCCAARVFSTYGPGLRRLAVWEIAQRARAGDLRIIGNRFDSRDYLHVNDVASALETLCRVSTLKWPEVNVASGQETTVEGLVNEIYGQLGVKSPCRYDGIRGIGNPNRWCADVTRLRSMGFAPQMALAEGIHQTLQWAESNA